MESRPLGRTAIKVSPVSMGCWPIAGMTSVGVSEADSLAALQASVDAGINTFDTAYSYGPNGESEKLIARALGQRRDEIVICTKVGLHWASTSLPLREGRGEGKANSSSQAVAAPPKLTMVHDAQPGTIRRECEESLRRLKTDRVDLLYLHAPDPSTPVEYSAGELKRLLDEGKARAIGVSNFTVEQMEVFNRVCTISAFQPPYNMILRDIEKDTLPWCIKHQASVLVYWPLMKGLLTGSLPRDFKFEPKDGRPKYPMFQGAEWTKNQDLLDALRPIAAEAGRTLSQLVINWTIHQPGITSAICGAKRPEQVKENASAMGWKLTPATMGKIDAALKARGTPVTRWAV